MLVDRDWGGLAPGPDEGAGRASGGAAPAPAADRSAPDHFESVAELLRHGQWYKGVPYREVEKIDKTYAEMSGSELVQAYTETSEAMDGLHRLELEEVVRSMMASYESQAASNLADRSFALLNCSPGRAQWIIAQRQQRRDGLQMLFDIAPVLVGASMFFVLASMIWRLL